jgi:HEAT repeat protein
MDRGTQVASLISLSRHGSPMERSAAIADLEELGIRESVPALLELLGYPDAGVRANLAQALGRLGGEGVGAALLTLLADDDALVRMKAAESLGELRHGAGLAALRSTLARDSDPLVRVHVVEALGDLQDPEALPSLLNALDDPDEQVRAYAADAIGRLGSDAVLDALLARVATETSVFATAFLMAACYRLGDDRSLPALVQLSETADDLLAATILNLAVELATAENARNLKDLIRPVARSRPSLRPEVESLMARLDAVDRAEPEPGSRP